MTDYGRRPCLHCGRVRDDPLHDEERGGLARDVKPRIEQHAYDPGERRHWVRRKADRAERRRGPDRRQLVRRMDDRIRLIEEAERHVTED